MNRSLVVSKLIEIQDQLSRLLHKILSGQLNELPMSTQARQSAVNFANQQSNKLPKL